MRILAFGEILWDIIEGKEHLGGAPFNYAAHTVQCGDEAAIISRVGKDALGLRALEACREKHVSTDLIQVDADHPTGTVHVTLKNGQPDYTIVKNVAYDFIGEVDGMKSLSERFDVFYFGSLVQRTAASANALKLILTNNAFKEIFYDVNLRKEGYSKSIVSSSLEFATIFKLNHEEAPVLSDMLFGESFTLEDFSKKLAATFQQLKLIIITAADKGCFVFHDRKLLHTPCRPVVVKDAVGAGDAFSAAFTHTFLLTNDPVRSAGVANDVGGFVASMPGALPTYPTRLLKALA